MGHCRALCGIPCFGTTGPRVRAEGYIRERRLQSRSFTAPPTSRSPRATIPTMHSILIPTGNTTTTTAADTRSPSPRVPRVAFNTDRAPRPISKIELKVFEGEWSILKVRVAARMSVFLWPPLISVFSPPASRSAGNERALSTFPARSAPPSRCTGSVHRPSLIRTALYES